jgi:integrase
VASVVKVEIRSIVPLVATACRGLPEGRPTCRPSSTTSSTTARSSDASHPSRAPPTSATSSACLTFLTERGICDLRLVRPPDLRAFLAEEAKRRPAPGSQARTVAALKCYFRFLVENEYLERDPAHVLRTPKKREAPPDVLDRRELGRLLAVVECDDVWQRHFPGTRERDRLLLALFAYAGLRRSELLGLEWDDVDLERRLIRVHRAKDGRQRVVPVYPALEPLFLDYLRFRASDPDPGPHGSGDPATLDTGMRSKMARARARSRSWIFRRRLAVGVCVPKTRSRDEALSTGWSPDDAARSSA